MPMSVTPESAPPASNFPYLATLNPAQAAAVQALDGPLLVLAGAGTGKTRVLTTRLGHIIHTRRAWPSQILAVTFTNKAAREMRDRVADLIGPMAQDLWIGTFHALAARILRRHAELVGLKNNFTILDTDDQLRLVKQLLEAERIDDKRWPARVLLGVIERWKDRALPPAKVSGDEAGELAGGKLIALYRAYQERLSTLNACDFGDLMLHSVELFQTRPEILEIYQQRFKYLLVDEYQDTNVVQYLWLRLLAQTHHNICCVGDEDQSIYGWRGAEIGNILRFESDFPGAQVVRLEQNYRSTGHILGAASGLIANNLDRLGKTLWTDSGEGEPVKVLGTWDGIEEARRVGDEIEALQRHGTKLREVAILVRAGFQTREFEERLMTLGVPYRVLGGLRFYERAEIRDAIAYLRVVAQPDDDLAFERIVNVPKRGLGDATVQAMHRAARADGTSLFVAAHRLVATDELKPAARKTLTSLLGDFDRWRALVDRMDHGELAETVLDESGYTRMWQLDKSPEAPGRLENLKELVSALEEFENLGGFLEHVSLVMERNEDTSADQVVLMTLHSAKGLEFDSVFLPGWEEGLFPHQRALDETGARGLEEERRLAYVGLTRARQRAFISYAANRRIHNQWQTALPSRFLGELPQDHLAIEAATGLYGGGMAADSQAWEPVAPRGGYAVGPNAAHWGPTWTSRGRDTGPGGNYGRGRAGGRGGGPVIEGRATEVKTRSMKSAYGVGARVFHQKFGYGTVLAVEADRLEIDFDKAGIKKVIDSFVQPEP
jgi:DNA helicase-2/ATP-dependent DNA helicase PcrA